MNSKIILILMGIGFSGFTFADTTHSLMGTWSSVCASDGSGNYNIETFKFKGNQATYSIKTFKDSKCQSPLSTLTTYRTFKLGNPVADLQNTRKLDYVFNKVTMTYNNDETVSAANKAPGYYGFTKWKLNQPKEVTGLKRINTEKAEHAKGEKFFTMVKIEKNELFMGDYASGTGTSDKGRLSKIYQVPFIKQK